MSFTYFEIQYPGGTGLTDWSEVATKVDCIIASGKDSDEWKIKERIEVEDKESNEALQLRNKYRKRDGILLPLGTQCCTSGLHAAVSAWQQKHGDINVENSDEDDDDDTNGDAIDDSNDDSNGEGDEDSDDNMGDSDGEGVIAEDDEVDSGLDAVGSEVDESVPREDEEHEPEEEDIQFPSLGVSSDEEEVVPKRQPSPPPQDSGSDEEMESSVEDTDEEDIRMLDQHYG